MYLYNSVNTKSHSTSILLINSGSCISSRLLSWIHLQTNSALAYILSGMTTSRIIEAYRISAYDYQPSAYTSDIRDLVNAELARRQIK